MQQARQTPGNLEFDFRGKTSSLAMDGDVIYGDTSDAKKLRSFYETQSNHPLYQKVKKNTQIIGTWDDHDYSDNNSDRTAKNREMSQKLFLDFLETPQDSPRRKQKGIYWQENFGKPGQEIAVFLLDLDITRTHGKLKRERCSVGINGCGSKIA